MKILTIIGTRPQIIKASAISRAIKNHFKNAINEIILHTGQHYDTNMSEVFFNELKIPKPNYNLNIGSGTHGSQTADMIKGIEEIIVKEQPDCMILYGDTNSTLAGAIAASKLHCKIVHIEAGLRSYNKTMPEEINRILCDHCSTLLFSPTKTGYQNLIKEGFAVNNTSPFTADNPKIYYCGDIMFDNTLHFSEIASQKSGILKKYNLKKNAYVLATIHRDNNTDNPERLSNIFEAILSIAKNNNIDFVIPLHPRTTKVLKENLSSDIYYELMNNKYIKIIEPVSFLDMIELEKHSILIVTDSGGVQKEAYFLQKPCIILRPQTEWVELIEHGSSIMADADVNKIINAANTLLSNKSTSFPPIFGNGKAADFICEEILSNFIPIK
ncbi:MAG: UDP-N-acetylglucosamine 2-epimerase (non-hydrolyzing) [Bacteroidetes bacterium]|nr:UDP-N-acetylglucosamine 2-epimerase (non-hydrolyzing) [Bacteroidota bacterium]